MARKPKPAAEAVDAPFDQQQLVSDMESVNMLAAVQADYNEERDLVNQLLGQVQMARSFARFADVVSLSKLKHIKETKMYRALAGKKCFDPDGNEIADVGTFDGFCQALGLSRSKVDEDLTNLAAFGEEALKQLSAIGAGYRELRQFRRLPEDQKTALIEVAKSGDKDSFLELAEDLIAKHAKEKETLTQSCETMQHELADVKGDLESSRKRVATLTTQLQGRKLEPPTPDSKAAELVAAAHEAESTACAWIDGHLKQAIADVLAHDGEHDSNHRAVLSGFIARIEDATDALRLVFALPRIKTGEDDPFAELPEDFLEKQGVTMPTPINGGPHAAN